MINTSELRIGNWVYLNLNTGGELFCTVEEIKAEELLLDFEGVKTRESYIMVNPVPLTSEIFENAGFVERPYPHALSLWINDIKWLYLNYHSDNNLYLLCYNEDFFNGGFHQKELPNIKYVHQLQNLYFNLTGEELKVNLPLKAIK